MASPSSGVNMLICSICDDVLGGDKTVLANSCGHVFHGQCIREWISSIRTKTRAVTEVVLDVDVFKGTCPICDVELCIMNCIRLYLSVDGDDSFGQQMLKLKADLASKTVELKLAQAKIAMLVNRASKPGTLNQPQCSPSGTLVMTRSRLSASIAGTSTVQNAVRQICTPKPKPPLPKTAKSKPAVAPKSNSSTVTMKRRSIVNRITPRINTTAAATSRISIGNSSRASSESSSVVFISSTSTSSGPVTRARARIIPVPTAQAQVTPARRVPVNPNRTRIGV